MSENLMKYIPKMTEWEQWFLKQTMYYQNGIEVTSLPLKSYGEAIDALQFYFNDYMTIPNQHRAVRLMWKLRIYKLVFKLKAINRF